LNVSPTNRFVLISSMKRRKNVKTNGGGADDGQDGFSGGGVKEE
jgi:hypothetical protein